MLERHRTKIVATLGPATDNPRALRECLKAGMDVARLNAAHGTERDKVRRILALREAAQSLGLPIGILVDLPGPKFRLGDLPGGQRELRRGELVRVAPSGSFGATDLPVRDSRFLGSVEPGHLLHLADGTVTLRAVRRTGASVESRVLVGGIVRSGSGINIPDTDLRIRIPTAFDLRGIAFAAAHKAEWIGVSFVRTAQDVSNVRRAFSRFRHIPRIIAKIEKKQALVDLDSILEEADGLMVARGDLGVETPLAQVPIAQKRIIARANEMGKPVITATQMLETMTANRWPTRAEVADVANAVLDGSDAVMLSAETAIGRYPAEAIRMMDSVLAAAEEVYPFRAVMNARPQKPKPTMEDAIGRSACQLAWDAGARAIVVSSHATAMPYSVSRFRPPMPIVVLSSDRTATQQLTLSWGVQPVLVDRRAVESLDPARRWLVKNKMARSGECVVWIHPAKKLKEEAGDSIRLASL